MRTTHRIELSPYSIGSRNHILIHQYKPNSSTATKKVYIQASLHADEIPGLLVCNHIIKILDQMDVKEEIIIVPFANPIGLSQRLLGTHLGRFSLRDGINFNREYPDISFELIPRLENQLRENDSEFNVQLIRKVIDSIMDERKTFVEDEILKDILFRHAATSDIVLDLHCDSDAVMHMYTHDRLWPQLADLAAEIKSHCHLLASASGGNPLDEICSDLWAKIADAYPLCSVPMACESVTIELRGQLDVSDDYSKEDALALVRFLQRRGYVSSVDSLPPLPPLIRDASPLTAVDMIKAFVPGVVVWNVKCGDMVQKDQKLGEIGIVLNAESVCLLLVVNTCNAVHIEEVDAPRTPVVSSTDGLVFGKTLNPLVFPGDVIIKVAGTEVLPWRSGNLLTS